MTGTSDPLRVAFQGELGAFSDEAAKGAFGAGVISVPFRTFEEMFDAVTEGRADIAMAPIENTLMGSIIKNYDLLIEHHLEVVHEVVLRIVHNLLVRPGTTIDDVTRVYSHPVALAQCERFLRAHRHIEVVPGYDTAGSVKDLMREGKANEAAIAGITAAHHYGATVLQAGIESNKQNFTRFLVLARPDGGDITGHHPQDPNAVTLPHRKTSIVFRMKNRPGGLYEALGAFARENVDLAKIESRPIEGMPWEYSFYLDLIGDQNTDAVKKALASLQPMTDSVRILGSYGTVRIGGD